MSTSAISAATAATTQTASSDSSSALPTQTLSQQDFLNLLITQMTSQDPLSPMDDSSFVTQMAQFSTLQATQQMGTNISQLSSAQQFSQANGLIGRQVQLQDSQGNQVSGTVSAVDLSSGTPQIVVNGTSYPLSGLLNVTAAPSN